MGEKKTSRTARRGPLHSIEQLEARIAPATFRVTTLADSGAGSLRAAIDQANAAAGADVIFFKTALTGTIGLRSDLPDIAESVSFLGSGAARMRIDGRGLHQIFDINGSDLDVTISGLTLTGGLAETGGAVRIDSALGSVKIARCVFSGNVAQGREGTEEAHFGGEAKGGAIAILAGSLVVEKSRFSGNKARGGLGYFSYVEDENGALVLDESFNGGQGHGGAIYAAAETQATISATVLNGNRAAGGLGGRAGSGLGGAIESNGSLEISRSVFTGNSAVSATIGAGGGIFNTAVATVTASVFTGNTAAGFRAFGGGICTDGRAVMTVEKSTVSGNFALGVAGSDGGAASGGGINNTGTLVLKISTVSANRAAGGNGDGGDGGDAMGGGIFNGTNGNLTIERSTISGNYAKRGVAVGTDGVNGEGSGGGVFAQSGIIAISQATIARNVATDDGGGLASITNAVAAIHNSTIAGNRAAGEGGGIFATINEQADPPAPVTVSSTIIAGNAAPLGPDASGPLEISFSLVQNIADAVLTGASNLTGVNPLLGKLRNYGGLVETMYPLPGSPAKDHGSNPDALTTDARGLPRLLGADLDIGADSVSRCL